MNRPKQRLQHANPYWIASLQKEEISIGQPLQRLKFAVEKDEDDGKYDEDWLQQLLHRFPMSLPVHELEPGFGDIISVGREMPTPAGSVDNVYVTLDGNIVLVECKLYRNSNARRLVIAQIIDYAQSMARWRYEDFDAAIRKSLGNDGERDQRALFEIVVSKSPEEVDETRFVAAINRNLRMGRFLLLVVGDGIREDTESLAEYLQVHAGFHFSLGLIEVGIWKVPAGGLIVQPRVLARTLNIERAVVRLEGNALTAEAVVDPASAPSQAAARSQSMTEELFFERLKASSPATAFALNQFLEKVKELGVLLVPATKSASLKWEADTGQSFNLGGVDLQGVLTTYSVLNTPKQIGCVGLAHEYLDGLAKIAGGEVRKTSDPNAWYVAKSGTSLPKADAALTQSDAWFALIGTYLTRLRDALAKAE